MCTSKVGALKKRLQALYYAGSAFLVCWVALVPAQLADPDLWGRLSVAALWFKNGRFPYRDVFSSTAFHHPWIDHEWLAGVVFYGALWFGGEIGLHVLKYGMILAIFYSLFSLCQKIAPTNKNLPLLLFTSLFLLFPIYGDAFYPTIRAQLFSFLFFACFLMILEQVRLGQTPPHSSKRLLWAIIPWGVIWANAHGGFILGLVLLVLYGLGNALDKKNLKASLPYWGTAAGTAALIALFNPYGFAYWPFMLKALTMPRPFISEWNALPLFTLDYWETKLLMLASLGGLLLTGWRQRKANPTGNKSLSLITPALVALFFVGLAIKGVRFKSFLALTVLFYIPALITAWRNSSPPRTNESNQPASKLTLWLPGIVALGALAITLCFYPPYYYARTVVQDGQVAQSQGLVPFPINMVNYLKASPYQGNLINPFSWGEFLAWNLYPRFKIAWDGRYEEVYTNAEFQPLTEFYALPHPYNPQRIWDLANQSAGDFILIEKISPNQEIMGKNPSWSLLYTDGFYFLYGRKTALKHFPPYNPTRLLREKPIYTIGDFFHPAEFNRFQGL